MKLMRKHYRILFALFIISSTHLRAQPPLPSGFYGSLTVNGEPVSTGAVVSAWINNVHYPSDFTVTSIGKYGLLLVNGDDPQTPGLKEGGVVGDIITFRVTINQNVYIASPTGTWEGNGVNRKLNLSADKLIPVELSSFLSFINQNSVELKWSTATETNNLGFEIQRSPDKINFIQIGFVKGNGTSSIAHYYTFLDHELSTGRYYYRLKQIDFDGAISYSPILEVDIVSPTKFELCQNFPNPFNPETTIQFSLPNDSQVTIDIYDIQGHWVRNLVNDSKSAGSYFITWDGKDDNSRKLGSGVYFYTMRAGTTVITRKMILMK